MTKLCKRGTIAPNGAVLRGGRGRASGLLLEFGASRFKKKKKKNGKIIQKLFLPWALQILKTALDLEHPDIVYTYVRMYRVQEITICDDRDNWFSLVIRDHTWSVYNNIIITPAAATCLRFILADAKRNCNDRIIVMTIVYSLHVRNNTLIQR